LVHPLMVPQFLHPDPSGPKIPGLDRYSITPFWNKSTDDWRQNLNMRTVYATRISHEEVVNVPSQFSRSGMFLGTGDTSEYMRVDPRLKGNNLSLSIRQSHFKQFYETTGNRPEGFDIHVAHQRTLKQLNSGMPFEKTEIGTHVARTARPLGLRMDPGTQAISRGNGHMQVRGTFSYQPIRARLDGIADGAKTLGKAAVQKAQSAGRAIRNAAAPGAAVGTGVGLAARGLMYGGTALKLGARALVPGVAEAMDAHAFVRSAGGMRVVAQSAIQPVVNTVRTAAAGATAAPAAAAATAVAAGVVGGVVGDFVEPHVTEATGSRTAGVASATLAGAATGALIGMAIGSIVPGLGTAAGAAIGGAAGAIGGFVGAYW
ncbi:MAG TPA: hypothetical protein VM187_16035, partial [Niastella sp.]|nr:hypothetical protein [Niastella sp.]